MATDIFSRKVQFHDSLSANPYSLVGSVDIRFLPLGPAKTSMLQRGTDAFQVMVYFIMSTMT